MKEQRVRSQEGLSMRLVCGLHNTDLQINVDFILANLNMMSMRCVDV